MPDVTLFTTLLSHKRISEAELITVVDQRKTSLGANLGVRSRPQEVQVLGARLPGFDPLSLRLPSLFNEDSGVRAKTVHFLNFL